MYKFTFFLFLVSLVLSSKAQTDTTAISKTDRLKLSCFADFFYCYDFSQPTGTKRQAFLYNHNRHNEFNLNLGIIKCNYHTSNFKANLAVQAGTYVNDNYASEPGTLKNIAEATIALGLNKKNTLWLEAGIFPSYIGFEGAMSIDNFTLTRSLLAENSPYYMTGTKLSFAPSKKWYYMLMATNGWQRIQKTSDNSFISIGSQFTYTPNEKVNFNWSTFSGTDDPDSTRRYRYFNNFYSQISLSKNWAMIAGFDIGFQQTKKHSKKYNTWYSPVWILRYQATQKLSTALRVEYYDDQHRVIISTAGKAFQTSGYSLNFDYQYNSFTLLRLEGRYLHSTAPVLNNSSNNYFITLSLACKING